MKIKDLKKLTAGKSKNMKVYIQKSNCTDSNCYDCMCGDSYEEPSYEFVTKFHFSAYLCNHWGKVILKKCEYSSIQNVKSTIIQGILFCKFANEESFVDIINNSTILRTLKQLKLDCEKFLKSVNQDISLSDHGKQEEIKDRTQYYEIMKEILTYKESDEFKSLFKEQMSKIETRKYLVIS